MDLEGADTYTEICNILRKFGRQQQVHKFTNTSFDAHFALFFTRMPRVILSRSNTAEERRQGRKQRNARKRKAKKNLLQQFQQASESFHGANMPCSGDTGSNPNLQSTSTPQHNSSMHGNLPDWPMSPVDTVQKEVRRTTEACLSFVAPQIQFQDLSEEYIQQKKLEWGEELDKTRADVMRNLKRLRDEANTLIASMKTKVKSIRDESQKIKDVEDGLLAIPEPKRDHQNGHTYLSIVQPAISLPKAGSCLDYETREVRQYVRRLEDRERRALTYCKNMSKRVEELEDALKHEQKEGERRTNSVRTFWRDKVFEGHTRGGMMIMASVRGIIRKLDSYLETDD